MAIQAEQLNNLLSDPTTYVHNLFSQHENVFTLHEKAGEIISQLTPDEMKKIPLLNVTSPLNGNIPNRSLVKFRCLIQDMFDPELYVASYNSSDEGDKVTRKCGLYIDSPDDYYENNNKTDVLGNDDNASSRPILGDRCKLLGISIPGENSWVNEYESSNNEMGVCVGDDSSSRQQFTRKVTDQECTVNCFPLPGKNLCAYMLLMYEKNLSVKLNEVLEVIGIIDYSHDEGEVQQENALVFEELTKSEFRPPRNIVPVIHVIYRKKLSHINPLELEKNVPGDREVFFKNCKSHLEAILRLILFQDQLASQYVICSLVSHVFSRRDLINVGAFPLGLTIGSCHNSRDFIRALVTLFSDLSTHSTYLPLTLEKLNLGPLQPKKNYLTNKLIAAPLQLATGTVLLIDETVMTSGQLNEQGVRNIATLRDLVKWQQLKYDFEYHSMDVDVDVPVIVVSQGKSLLQVPLTLPVDHKEEMPKDLLEAIKEYLTPQLLQALRVYLTMARQAQIVIGEEVQEKIQSDFVKMRQENGTKVNGETLHQLMSLARLVSVSEGEDSLSIGTWKKVLDMEDQRMTRLVSGTTGA